MVELILYEVGVKRIVNMPEIDYLSLQDIIDLHHGIFTEKTTLREYHLFELGNSDRTIIDKIIQTKYKNEISRKEINKLIKYGPDACDYFDNVCNYFNGYGKYFDNAYEYFDKNWYKICPKCTCRDAYNWIMGPLLKVINDINIAINAQYSSDSMDFSSCHIYPCQLGELINLVNENKITRENAINLLENTNHKSFFKQAQDKNLLTSTNTDELNNIIKSILINFTKDIQDYKNGNEKAFKFLTGKVMKEVKGKFDPKLIQTKLKEIIDEM